MHRKSVYLLVLSVVVLVVLGIVMLFSTSAFAQDAHGQADFFLKRQGMWLGVGVAVCLISSRLDYHVWQRVWWIVFLLAVVLLALCYVHGIGQRINGSSRWLNLRVASFQPSELGKVAAICTLAAWFGRERRVEKEFLRGFVYPLIPSGILLALIAPEVDMGSTALIGTTTYILMYVAGTRLRYLAPMALIAVAGMSFMAMHIAQRHGRLLAFWYPEKYPKEAYQAQQGLIAIGSGGISGLGLGNGRQKLAYLPEAHTDFIFDTIGEELGLRCTLLVVFTYIVFIMCGAFIAVRARDRFGLIFGLGFVLLIALQAAVNIGVTTSLLPNKGLPLPFISYGGSNLVFCLLGVGVLINIYRQGVGDREARETQRLDARIRVRRRQPAHI